MCTVSVPMLPATYGQGERKKTVLVFAFTYDKNAGAERKFFHCFNEQGKVLQLSASEVYLSISTKTNLVVPR